MYEYELALGNIPSIKLKIVKKPKLDIYELNEQFMVFPRDFGPVDHQEVWLLPCTLGNVGEAQMVSVDLQRAGWM